MHVPLVNNATALMSMRESDFDACSAFGEVLDNSIQAGASEIKIHIEYEKGSKHELIASVAFGDDGSGMPEEVLHQCLQLGYSTRYNDRSGIGRFGVGATLAAINQCQKIAVYTKEQEGVWKHTYIDLEEIQNEQSSGTGIPSPKKGNLPKGLTSLTGKGSGTLVVWEKYDRQPKKASQMIDELLYWIGRTYRYFIWDDGLSISLNGKSVHAIDPLYIRTEKTLFPDDPKAQPYEPDGITWPVPKIDSAGSGNKKSKIVIRMSLLPEEFRQQQGAGNTKESRDRFIHLNEGISILRNRREVFYDRIPYWSGQQFAEVDRWWGCEIEFDAILDREFAVKNIKRGAVPIKDLKDALVQRIDPTRKTALEQVRELWSKNDAARKRGSDGYSTGHEGAERVGVGATVAKNQIDKGKSRKEESKELAGEILTDADAKAEAALRSKFEGQPFTITDKNWKGPHFFDTHHLGGTSVLQYNISHIFFDEINEIQKQLEEDSTINPFASHLKDLIDILLMSYAKAEAMFDPEIEHTAENFEEQLRINWGNYLKTYTIEWRKSEKTTK